MLRKESCPLVHVAIPLQDVIFSRRGSVRVSAPTSINEQVIHHKLYGNNTQGINLVFAETLQNKAWAEIISGSSFKPNNLRKIKLGNHQLSYMKVENS